MDIRKWVSTLIITAAFALMPMTVSASAVDDLLAQVQGLLKIVASLQAQIAQLTGGAYSTAPESQRSIDIVAPNGGEVFTIGQPLTISWSTAGSFPEGSQVCVTLVGSGSSAFAFPAEGGSCVQLNTQNTQSGQVLGTITRNSEYNLTPGTYVAQVQVIGSTKGTENGGLLASDVSDSNFTIIGGQDSVPAAITITSPNGGEQFEIGTLNTILWTPHSSNPSNAVSIYLERKFSGRFINVGRIIDTGDASFHTYFNLNNFDSLAQPGEYYVRVVNNATGDEDRSDASFTLLPRSVDLKVNGSDGPMSLTDRKKIALDWSSVGATTCTAHRVGSSIGSATSFIENLPASGRQDAYVWITESRGTNISMTCKKSDGTQTATDYVQVRGVASPASLAILNPNGGEKININEETFIELEQEGVRAFSIALYKNGQWMKWIEKDIIPTDDGTYIHSWTPLNGETELTSLGDVFTIHVTGQRADGIGFLNDTSDEPFSFVAGASSVSSTILSKSKGIAALTSNRVFTSITKTQSQVASVIQAVGLLLSSIKSSPIR